MNLPLIDRLNRGRLVVAAALAVVFTALDRIKQIADYFDSSTILYAAALVDLHKYDLLLAGALWMIWPLVKGVSGLPSACYRLVRYKRSRNTGLVIGALAVGLVGAIAWHARFFVAGRELLLEQHDRTLTMRAARSFIAGYPTYAELNLKACSRLFPEGHCEQLLDDLHTRQRVSEEFREVFDQLPLATSGRYQILRDVYWLDYDGGKYDRAAEEAAKNLAAIDAKYQSAVRKAYAGQRDAAMSLLAAVEEKYPGFRDAGIILAQLKGRGAFKTEAYLDALKALGPEEFLKAVPASAAPSTRCKDWSPLGESE